MLSFENKDNIIIIIIRPGAVHVARCVPLLVADGRNIDPHVRNILSLRFFHENISADILPLPLIQEEQYSVNGERMYMYTKYW